MWLAGRVFFEDTDEDFDRVGILKNFEERGVHAEVFDGLEH